LLTNGPPVGSRLRQLIIIADDWFNADPSPTPYAIRATLRDLMFAGWDDDQGIPQADGDRFQKEVLPHLFAVLDDNSEIHLATYLVAIRDFRLALPAIVVNASP